ncbi:hypothetical protein [Sphingobacterium siyangense]|jgi:hypothetical protein|uniref:hypothetical protein n=1 Tax=Sphingobacterium siyangense TaxID=459529 RepID=UPI0028A7285A|nr:hypothetical protein [Sphingobacterium siyangense]
MKKLNLKELGIASEQILTRSQLKGILGGLGCETHKDCPSGYACVKTTWNGAYQGVCCNSAEMHDPTNVCGGGSGI